MTAPARTPRAALAALLTVLLAATALTVLPGAAGAAGPGNEAVLTRYDAFFRNQYAEVGTRDNGSFGSNRPQPAGWHGNFTSDSFSNYTADPARAGLGFRSDREKNGWGVGTDDGDFFLPGSPYEGWFLQTSGASLRNSNFDLEVPGGFVAADSAGDPSITWDSSDISSGLLVHQTYSLPSDGSQTINMDVTLSNPSGAPVTARYGRGVDPDNCVQYMVPGPPTCPNPGREDYFTTNTILSQARGGDARSAVSATAADGSDLVLWTSEPDSLAVSFGRTFGDDVPLSELDALPLTADNATPANVSERVIDEAFTKVGNAHYYDSGMTVMVKKVVPANGSVTFRVSYSLSSAAFVQATTDVDLTEGPLDTMTVGTPFTFPLEATGIAVPTYTVTAGAIPAGLSLDPTTGEITGTPTVAGDYDFSVTATGTEGNVTKQYTGTVLAAPGVPPTWTTTTLSGLVVGSPATGTATAEAPGNATGAGTITYEVLGDQATLPAGLSLDPSTGAITGTPTTPGPFSFTVVATNEFGLVAHEFAGVVYAPPTWTDTTLGAPTKNVAYSDAVAAAGTGPIAYAVTAGRLPAGLTLNPATGAVTGRPTTAGPALFVITASNAYGSVTHGFGMVVAAAPRTTARGTVFFVGTTTKPTADGNRVLARLAAAAPRGAVGVRVTVEGWAEFKRGPLPVVVRLAKNRTTFVTRNLLRRGLAGTYEGRTGGRYPVPGPTGRRAEVTVSWETPVG